MKMNIILRAALTLHYYLNHQLGRINRFAMFGYMVRWQTGSLMLGLSMLVPLVDRTFLRHIRACTALPSMLIGARRFKAVRRESGLRTSDESFTKLWNSYDVSYFYTLSME
jgi:hypothetical protein